MSSQDTKDPPLDPAQAAATATGNAGPPPSIQEAFPASDPITPFLAARGVVLDGNDIESVRANDNEVEPSMAANGDVEHVPETAPEQIDPGSDGKLVI